MVRLVGPGKGSSGKEIKLVESSPRGWRGGGGESDLLYRESPFLAVAPSRREEDDVTCQERSRVGREERPALPVLDRERKSGQVLRDPPESGAQKSGKSTFAPGPRKVPLEEQGEERGYTQSGEEGSTRKDLPSREWRGTRSPSTTRLECQRTGSCCPVPSVEVPH